MRCRLANLRKGWINETKQIMELLSIKDEDLQGSKYSNKKTITRKAEEYFEHKISTEGSTKSKISHLTDNTTWKTGRRKEYLNRLTRNQSSTLFKARTRMLKVKSNYKTQYKNNLICRACGQQEETQKHILEECHNLHPTPGTKVTTSDIFHQEYIIQKYAAIQIEDTMKKLENGPQQH